MNPWTKEYAPKTLKDIVGHEKEVATLKMLVGSHRKGSKPIFLYGGTGNGKTSSVHALANELGLELVEVNASDVRKADAINNLLGSALAQQSLFFKGKIILVDEVEGLSGTKDRGGLQAVSKLVEKSSFPIVLIGMDAYDQKFKDLRKKSELIEFKPLSVESVFLLLERVSMKEKIDFDRDALKHLARSSGGDARAAVNDLQSAASAGKLTLDSVKNDGYRDTVKSMEDALLKVFKSTNLEVALRSFDDVKEDLDKIFLWVEENIPKEYLKHDHLLKAFESVSLADVFYGRIRKRQYYRFYVYCYALLSAGIALSKDEKYSSAPDYKPTSRLLKIWIANQRYAKRKAIAHKIGVATHVSQKRALHDSLPFVKKLYAGNRDVDGMTSFFDFNMEEVEWLKK